MGQYGMGMDGTEWLLAIGLVGFVLAYLLAKLSVLSEKNVTTFSGWSAAVLALVLASNADGMPNGSIGFLGRIAIFALVWFAGGIVLTVGAMAGIDKARKSNNK